MNDLVKLAQEAAEVFRRESSLVSGDFSEVIVVGDTHGDVDSSRRAFEAADERGAAVVFLGDYVDRGPYQLENISLVFERKTAEPRRVILLRGNHETLSMNTYYGFLDVVTKRHGLRTYKAFLEAFKQMPYVFLWRDIICLHGGLPKNLTTVKQLEQLSRGEEDPEDPIVFQLMWNDPYEAVKGFVESDRGGGALYFGEDVFDVFMKHNGLRLMIRSHQPMPNGYRFFFGGRLLTVFSCRYYDIAPKAAVLDRHKNDVGFVELG